MNIPLKSSLRGIVSVRSMLLLARVMSISMQGAIGMITMPQERLHRTWMAENGSR